MVHRTRARQAELVWTEFVRQYPSAGSAAAATDDTLLNVLRPLGLHWRACNIVRAVRVLAGDPAAIQTLRALSGVGHYATAVVETVCYGRAAPIVDANVVRIYSRFFGLSLGDGIRRNRRFHDLALSMLPQTPSGRIKWFWALMDLGGTVCVTSAPRCEECPVAARCHFATSHLLNSAGSNSSRSSGAKRAKS
ncbi:MAG: hypothetical protein ACKVT1_00305 [Dehalococcoidia bacterium]